MTSQVVGGLDGCRAGWVLATAPADGPVAGALDVRVARPRPGPGRTRVRPLGRRGHRHPDRPARRAGRGRATRRRAGCSAPDAARSSPRRCARVLGAPTYAEACDLSRRVCGRALSKQLFNILPKIREVDALQSPGLQAPALRDAPRAQLHGPRRRPDAVQQAHGRGPGRAGVRAARPPSATSTASSSPHRRPERSGTTCSMRWWAPGRPAATWPVPTSGSAASSTSGTYGWRSSPDALPGAAEVQELRDPKEAQHDAGRQRDVLAVLVGDDLGLGQLVRPCAG